MRKYPLLIAVLTTAVLMTLLGYLGRDTVYARYVSEDDNAPLLTLPFVALTDRVYPWTEVEETDGTLLAVTAPSIETEAAEQEQAAEEESAAPAGEEDGEAPAEEAPAASDAAAQAASEEAPAEETPVEEALPEGEETAGEGGEAAPDNAEGGITVAENVVEVVPDPVEEKTYTFTQVDDSYFADAVFIGDSRTVGLMEYCKPMREQATFYAKTSLTIYDCMTDPFLKDGDRKITVDEALQMRQFGKVYLMLGLNEMGTGDDASFIEQYYRVVARILELQPNAILYVEGLMHVTANKSARDRIFNNERINNRNEVIALLADNKRIFYINMNEATDDANGNLIAELSFDGVHLYARAYERWHEFLLNHAIVK